MSITSEEVNYLIYRYLLEAGYSHSSFAFGHESMVTNSQIRATNVPQGHLISIIQKGVQYMDIETHLTQEGILRPCSEKFSLLEQHICINKNSNTEQETGVMTLQGHSQEVFSCDWNKSRKLLATGSSDSTVRIWDLRDPFSSIALTGLGKEITALEWSHSGEYLAAGSLSGKCQVWTFKGELLFSVEHHQGPVFVLKWNLNDTKLLSGGMDKNTLLMDLNGQVQKKFELAQGSILDADWKDSQLVAISSADSNLYLINTLDDSTCTLTGHKDEVNSLKFDPSGQYLASGCDDSVARVWDCNLNSCILELVGHSKEIYVIEWSPSSKPNNLVIATASFDSTIRIWHNNETRFILKGHTEPVYTIDFSPCGQYLVSGSKDQATIFWSVADGSVVKKMIGNSGIFDVKWNQEGTRVACCRADSTVQIIDFP